MSRDPKQPFYSMTAPKITAEDFAPQKRTLHPIDIVIPLCCVALTIAMVWALYMTVLANPVSTWSPA